MNKAEISQVTKTTIKVIKNIILKITLKSTTKIKNESNDNIKKKLVKD